MAIICHLDCDDRWRNKTSSALNISANFAERLETIWSPKSEIHNSITRNLPVSWTIGPIRLFAYEAGPIKLLVSGRLCMSSSGYLVEDRFFLSKKRRYLDYIPTGHLCTSSHKSHFKPPKSWIPWGPFNNCPLVISRRGYKIVLFIFATGGADPKVS